MIDAGGLAEIRGYYDQSGLAPARPADVVYESKRAILLQSMASELQMLSAELYRIAQQHRASRDFTRPALQRALREVIACMTVYRTYVRSDSWDVSEADYRIVTTAVRMAKRRNRTFPASVFDFISSVLLLGTPADAHRRASGRAAPVRPQTAASERTGRGKGRRRHGVLSLLSAGIAERSRRRARRQTAWHRRVSPPHAATHADWPHSLSATATHDSKRGEDMRARLHVLCRSAARVDRARSSAGGR